MFRRAALLVPVAVVMSSWLTGCGGDDTQAPTDASAESDAVLDAPSGADAKDVSVEAESGSEAGSDARRDAAPDVSQTVEAGPPPPDPARALAAISADCLDCAQANCSNYLQGCRDLSGSADAGPGSGTTKSALCVETVSCILSTGCASCDDAGTCFTLARYGECYCDWMNPNVAVVPDFCNPPSGPFAGPCKGALERSLETTDPTALQAAFSDINKGGGWALQLLQCLDDNACNSCFIPPVSDAGRDGAADAGDGAADARADGTVSVPSDAGPDARADGGTGDAADSGAVDGSPAD